jgi:hypothetical protein
MLAGDESTGARPVLGRSDPPSILGRALVNQLYFLCITPCPKEYFRFTGKMEGYLPRGVALSRPIAVKLDLAEGHTR